MSAIPINPDGSSPAPPPPSSSGTHETTHLSTGMVLICITLQQPQKAEYSGNALICESFPQLLTSWDRGQKHDDSDHFAGMMVFSMIIWMSLGHKLSHRCAPGLPTKLLKHPCRSLPLQALLAVHGVPGSYEGPSLDMITSQANHRSKMVRGLQPSALGTCSILDARWLSASHITCDDVPQLKVCGRGDVSFHDRTSSGPYCSGSGQHLP